MLLTSGLLSEHVQAVEWEKTQLQELDITGTDLSSECLIDLLTRIPALRWLSAGQQDNFTDSVTHSTRKSSCLAFTVYHVAQVLRAFADQGNARSLIALDLDRCESLSEDALYKFLIRFGPQLRGLILSGIPHVTDQLWTGILPSLRHLKILVTGMPEGCCPKIHQKVLF